MTDTDRNIRMISSPIDWPKWPVLPLKHRRRKLADDDALGVLLATAAPPFTVYVGCMFFIDPDAKTWGDAMRNFKTAEYADINALCEDWEVD